MFVLIDQYIDLCCKWCCYFHNIVTSYFRTFYVEEVFEGPTSSFLTVRCLLLQSERQYIHHRLSWRSTVENLEWISFRTFSGRTIQCPLSLGWITFRLPLQPKLEKLQRWTFFLFSHLFQYLWYFPCLFAVVRPPLLRFYSYIMNYMIWAMGFLLRLIWSVQVNLQKWCIHLTAAGDVVASGFIGGAATGAVPGLILFPEGFFHAHIR